MKFGSIIPLTLFAALASAEVEIGLRELAGDFNIGFAINGTWWEGVPGYTETANKVFNMAVAENACKFIGIQAERGVYDFTECDSHLEKAKELNMGFRGHCLVWHSMQPEWFMNLKGNELREAIVDHITTVLTHYRGKIDTWDVVNEAIDNSSDGVNWVMTPSFLYREVPDFVDLAFKTAREVDPNVKLYYNDYSTEASPSRMKKTLSVYNFVKDMVQRGVPIDGVGIQYHVKTNTYPSYEDVMDLMAKYAELGLEVQITEMDVNCLGGNTPEEFEKQAEIFATALRACIDSPNCTAFLIWGLADNLSWKYFGYPTLFDNDLVPKPAYYSLLDVLKEYNDKKETADDSSDEEVTVNGEPDVNEEPDSDSGDEE